MRQLGWPTIFCNSLIVDSDGMITGYSLRQNDGKRKAIEHLRGMGFRTFAAGDSYNDITMIRTADDGAFFRAPKEIADQYRGVDRCDDYASFMKRIRKFVDEGK